MPRKISRGHAPAPTEFKAVDPKKPTKFEQVMLDNQALLKKHAAWVGGAIREK